MYSFINSYKTINKIEKKEEKKEEIEKNEKNENEKKIEFLTNYLKSLNLMDINTEYQFIQAQLNLYQLMSLSPLKIDFSDIYLKKLIDKYMHLIDNLYNNKINSSQYLYETLINKNINTNIKTKEKRKIAIALNIISFKILLLNTDIKLLQIEIANYLKINWLPNVFDQLVASKKEYLMYDMIDLFYINKKFIVNIRNDRNDKEEEEDKQNIFTEEFLYDLVFLADNYNTDILDLYIFKIVENENKKVNNLNYIDKLYLLL